MMRALEARKRKNQRWKRALKKASKAFRQKTEDLANLQSVISKTPRSVLTRRQKAKFLSKHARWVSR